MKKKPTKPLPTVARMVLTSRDASRDQPIFYQDAIALGLDRVDIYASGIPCFMMPRTIEQVLRDELPQFSRAVQDAIQRAKDAGAKL